VVVGEPGDWRRADILDFKTDGFGEEPPGEEALAAKAAYYRGQLQSYRAEIARQFRLAPESISMRLAFVSAGVVVALDGLGSGASLTGVAGLSSAEIEANGADS
jgi:hypothetical protein